MFLKVELQMLIFAIFLKNGTVFIDSVSLQKGKANSVGETPDVYKLCMD